VVFNWEPSNFGKNYPKIAYFGSEKAGVSSDFWESA
jgi:hypothetical protein